MDKLGSIIEASPQVNAMPNKLLQLLESTRRHLVRLAHSTQKMLSSAQQSLRRREVDATLVEWHTTAEQCRLQCNALLSTPLVLAELGGTDIFDIAGKGLPWFILATLGAIAGIRARLRNQDTNKLQVSLGVIKQDVDDADRQKLYLRQVLENRLDILLADHPRAAGVIKSASKRAIRKNDINDPLVRIPERHRAMVQRALAKLIRTETKLHGSLEDWSDSTVPMEERTFYLALTMENYGLKRNEIPRLIMIPEWMLREIDEDEASTFAYDKPHQKRRIATHNAIVKDWESGDPEACFRITIQSPVGPEKRVSALEATGEASRLPETWYDDL
jgi:hypothetical protein